MKRTLRSTIFVGLFLIVLLIIVTRNAWMGDDAYITLRTVDNFVNGYGLRWNIAERVQTYTHPLWMLVLSACYCVTREAYFTTLAVSIVLSVSAAAVVAFYVARSCLSAVVCVVLLASSKAFVEYSTSGLENPLSFLLLALFAMVLLRDEINSRRMLWLSLIGSLMLVNRHDLLLLTAPSLIWYAFRLRDKKAWIYLLYGMTPFIAWELFSLIYYGYPVPNTAYAKLNTGIPALELIRQGWAYIQNSFTNDPITISVCCAAGVAVVMMRTSKLFARYAALYIGIVLYMLYVVKVGGGFMSGRFFAVPYLAGTILLSQYVMQRKAAVLMLGGVVVAVLFSPSPPYFRSARYGLNPEHYTLVVDPHKIADEQLFYFQATGLLTLKKGKKPPYKINFVDRNLREMGEKMRSSDQKVFVYSVVGMAGYYAGPKVHIIDQFALGDPLLSKLPAVYDPNWRIGHFLRALPDGYPTSVTSGVNRITDPMVAEYYDRIKLITRAPLFNARRIKAVFMENFGKYFSHDYHELHEHLKKYRYNVEIEESLGVSL